MSNAKIYSVGDSNEPSLLVEGVRVINGAYDLEEHDGKLYIHPPYSDELIPCTYLMDAPCEGDYNTVLNRAREIHCSN